MGPPRTVLDRPEHLTLWRSFGEDWVGSRRVECTPSGTRDGHQWPDYEAVIDNSASTDIQWPSRLARPPEAKCHNTAGDVVTLSLGGEAERASPQLSEISRSPNGPGLQDNSQENDGDY